MIVGPIRAELLKLGRSWSTRILVGIVVLAQLLLGYLLIWAILQVPDTAEGGLGDARGAILATLRPDQVVSNVLGILAGLGGTLALVLGALCSAREYGWRTVASILTQGTDRLGVLGAKAAALAIVLLVMDLATFGAGAGGSALVSSQAGGDLAFPPPAELAAGIGAGWLILAAWASIGLALGLLLRSTGLAIGLGLAYGLVIESLIATFGTASPVLEAASRGLLGANAGALARSFGRDVPPELGGSPLLIAPGAAALVLAAYIVVALGIAGAVFRARDVT